MVFLFSGCASMSFKHSEYISFEGLEPLKISSDYSKYLPGRFELLNSAIFRYRNSRFAGLGVIRLDTSKESLDVVGFSHLGVMLFDLSLNKGKVTTRYIFPEFLKYENFSSIVLADIQKIYFDRLPPLNSKIKKEKYKIIFKDIRSKNRSLDYVFYGEGKFLSEKHFFEGRRKTWSVFYYDYEIKDGKIYPKAIVLKNYLYGYELIIISKEIRQS